MSFREKSAWIALVTTILVYAIYFVRVVPLLGGAHEDGFSGTLGASVFVLVALQVGLHVGAAIRAPRDASAPRDERDRSIDLRATRAGFYVAQAGAFTAIASALVRPDAWFVANVVLMSMVAAEIARAGVMVADYRRQAA
jgi:archaellum biogenesis protein FlaJ (TadC family)